MTSDERTRIYSMNRFNPGVRLNDTYELDERIASGGMGEVYRGHNIETGEPVAIKTVLPELVGDDTVFSLFKKEGTILGRLNHPCIVRYYSFSRDPKIGRPYLVMEFVEGQSLADRIKTAPLSLPETRELFVQVADGLALAHKAGVIHRDLSPDNIILQHGEVAQPKIIDFGIARTSNVSEHSILGGSFAGKFSFVSPEQLGLLDREVTNRSDIYSMGLVMAAALRGKPLDMGSLPAEVVEKRRTVPDLGSIDASVRPLLEWMLQPDARNRPHGMLEIADWLKHPPGSDRARQPASEPAAAEPAQQGAGAHRRSAPDVTEPPSPPAPGPVSAARDPEFVEHVSPVLKGRTVFRARQSKPVPALARAAVPARSRGRSVVPMLVVAIAAVTAGGVYYAGGFDFLRGQVAPTDEGTPPLAENRETVSKGDSRPISEQAGSDETGSKIAQRKAPADTSPIENQDRAQAADNTHGSAGTRSNVEAKPPALAVPPKPNLTEAQVRTSTPAVAEAKVPSVKDERSKPAAGVARPNVSESEKAAPKGTPASTDPAENREGAQDAGIAPGSPSTTSNNEAKPSVPAPSPKPETRKAEAEVTPPAAEPAPPPEVEVASKAVPETGRPDAVERERAVQQDVPATIDHAEDRASAPASDSAPGSRDTQPSAPVVSPKTDEAEAEIKETAPSIKPKPPLPKDDIASEAASGTTRTEMARNETARTGGDSASTAPPPTATGKAVGEQQTVALNEQTTGSAGEEGAGNPVDIAPVAPPVPGKSSKQVTDNGSGTTADRAAAQEQTVALNTETTDAPASGREAAPTPNPEDCFFAAIDNQSDEAMTIKGIGLSMAPFERIKSALASSDSGDARIDSHIITASQCPAAAFIKEIYGTTTDNPKLNFTSAGMVSGDAVAGSVNNVHSRRVHLFMVDGKGVVYDLQDNLAIANNPPLFRLTFGPARANFAPPGVIIALTSDQPIDLGPPFGAASSLPALARTLADRGDVSGIDFAFFPYRSLGSASSP